MTRSRKEDRAVAELQVALINGAFETPQWNSFLSLLRALTQADFASLVLQPPGRPMDDGLQLIAGDVDPAEVTRMYRKYVGSGDVAARAWPEDGKPYTFADLLSFDQPYRSDYYREVIEVAGIADSWQIRVSEPNGVLAWLSIAHKSKKFGERDGALLREIGPALRGVVRTYVAGARSSFQAKMAKETVRRLQCGWLLLDRDGYVLASDDFGAALLANSDVLARNRKGRLIVTPIRLEREVLQVLSNLIESSQARPRAITLCSDPWLDVLLVPARKHMISETAVPAAVAYIHRDNWSTADRRNQLVDLFGLSPSEARLALALCRGKGIAESARELGITAETARGYSKVIYAKTGTRGQADLVRVIMGSVLTLAPEA
jgi:DNA-binding CsgD family transcriptional regulator